MIYRLNEKAEEILYRTIISSLEEVGLSHKVIKHENVPNGNEETPHILLE